VTGPLTRQLSEAWRTVRPAPDDPHGPLPGLLVGLTVVTGLVDAFSYLALGRVFVANMTGNVVFLAFALGGAAGFVWWASLVAVGAFLLGAYAGGAVGRRHGDHRGRHLMVAAGIETGLVLVALVVAWATGAPYHRWTLAALVVVLGVGLGLQNATARALSVPDLTTTVLTMTLTGVSSDTAESGQGRLGRRVVSVASMFVGGLVGAALVVHGHPELALLVAGVLLVAVTLGAARHRATRADWTAAR
jgi:uncharacterized membrane protein YoaK (UPF0700 family)